jgi:diguanylate cyclase (GGDEF)-like protein/PAS domain S-box-containing protein
MHADGAPTPAASVEGGGGDSASHSTRAELYRTLIGRSAHVVLLVDSLGTILDVSDEITDRFGYDPGEVVGVSAFNFIHPSDRHLVAVELIREVQEPERSTQSIVARAKHRDGSYRDVEVLGISHLDNPDVGGVVVSLRDITGRRVSERVMAAGAYLFTATATVASDAITMFDADGQRVYSSPTVEPMFGYSPDELITVDPGALVHPEDRPALMNAMRTAMRTDNGSARVETRIVHRSGSILWIESTFVNLLKHREVGGVVVHMRDIDERRRLQEELRKLALEDSLTGVGNRLAFNEALASRAAYAGSQPMTLLYCDLDGFKQINDDFGHSSGDALLKNIATSLKAALSPDDFVARIGGDEFCVLSQQAETQEQAMELAKTIRTAITSNSSDTASVGVSIGVVWCDEERVGTELLTAADHAMYRAKRRGPNLIQMSGSPVSSAVS